MGQADFRNFLVVLRVQRGHCYGIPGTCQDPVDPCIYTPQAHSLQGWGRARKLQAAGFKDTVIAKWCLPTVISCEEF